MEIELTRLWLRRAGGVILRDITWRVRPAERWLLVGGSGAGKTQLLKIIAGDVWPDVSARPARRYFSGGEWHEHPFEARDEIAWLGPERQDRYERYGWNQTALAVVGTGLHRTDIPLERLSAAERAGAARLLRRAGIARLARRRFLTLSYGERRLVLLARALAWRAQLLLLDEAATGLDAAHRARLFRLLSAPRSAGSGWICSAHRAEDIPPGATHLLWLEAGHVRYAGRLTKTKLREALASARERDVRPGRAKARAALRPASVVSLAGASVWIDGRRLLRDIDLTVRRGECWVVHGANGAGKSTLLATLYGDHAVAAGGTVARAGVKPGVPLEAFRARTGLVAPQLQTDYPRHCRVLDAVVSGLHSSIGLNFGATPAEKRRARAALRSLGIEALADRPLAELSYGQVRRVLFARAVVARPRLLLLDEPFTGLDAQTRGQLQDWLERQIGKGVTVVIATHYLREWPRNATHELKLSRGRVEYAGTLRP